MDSDEMVYQRPYSNTARIMVRAKIQCPTCDEPVNLSIDFTADDDGGPSVSVEPC